MMSLPGATTATTRNGVLGPSQSYVRFDAAGCMRDLDGLGQRIQR